MTNQTVTSNLDNDQPKTLKQWATSTLRRIYEGKLGRVAIQELVQSEGVVNIPGRTEPFNVKEELENKKSNFFRFKLGPDFERRFTQGEGKVEISPPAQTLSYGGVPHIATPFDLSKRIEQERCPELMFYHALHMTYAQKQGDKGPLFADGRRNIFLLRDGFSERGLIEVIFGGVYWRFLCHPLRGYDEDLSPGIARLFIPVPVPLQ